MVTRLTLVLLVLPMDGQVAAQVVGEPRHWRVIADVPLPGKPARFDYQSFDSTTGLLWIAHMGAGELLAFDVGARRLVAACPVCRA